MRTQHALNVFEIQMAYVPDTLTLQILSCMTTERTHFIQYIS